MTVGNFHVGTGTGWLAIAVARTFPTLRVVGLDVLPEALDLARRNVAQVGLDERVELRLLDAAELDAMSARRFARMDANGDGKVTAEERAAARSQWRGRMGGEHGGGSGGNGGGWGQPDGDQSSGLGSQSDD
ncbi:MAG: methyltransferase domain-containing protein [Thermoplasmatota archaeon]